MNILLYDMGSFTYRDVEETLKSLGNDITVVIYPFTDRYRDGFFSERISQILSLTAYDLIFSVNYFPLVAQAAAEYGIPYLSWSYDSPLAERLEETFPLETNYIYLFDRTEVETYRQQGYTRIFHMPLAVNPVRLEKLLRQTPPADYSADLSFVGNLYTSSLDALLAPTNDYEKGYLQAAMDVQMQFYGCDLITPSLTDEFLAEINGTMSSPLTRRGLAFALQKQITYAERSALVCALSELCNVRHYSSTGTRLPAPVHSCGPVKYYSEMPFVFRDSRLNLCPTLRSIISGIPLRCLDIMASGGALLCNYQPELAENFIDGEDVILYNCLEEALDKTMYYLDHEDERKQIALSAKEKVSARFRYSDAITAMLQDVKRGL